LEVSQLSKDDVIKNPSVYELIVSVDCLEHLKPLPEYIKLFNISLRNGGYLLVKSSFYGRGLHLLSNYKYDCLKTFNEMMRNNGFVLKGQLITRLKRNFLIPYLFLKLLKSTSTSGKKLIYIKRKSLYI